MKLFKKIINIELNKNYIFLLIVFFLLNNLMAFGSDNKSNLIKNKHKSGELEEIYKLKSLSYSDYDNLGNQLKTFFGLYSQQSETNNYPDLSIIDTSDAIREGYILKLNNMTTHKTNYKIKKEVLFKN